MRLNPECEQGKHGNCDAQTWHEDRLCRCHCACHGSIMVRGVKQGGNLELINEWLAVNNLPDSHQVLDLGVVIDAQLISVTSAALDERGNIMRDEDGPVRVTSGHPLIVPLPVELVIDHERP